jgi:NADH dehydrogenase
VNLGRYKAVAQVMGVTLRGFPAWWLARSYHVTQIPGIARKVRAVLDWTIGLPFDRDIAELGTLGRPRPLSSAAYERAGTHRSPIEQR